MLHRRDCTPWTHRGTRLRRLERALPQITGVRQHVRFVHERQMLVNPLLPSSKANRMQRSTPIRVFTEPCVAIS